MSCTCPLLDARSSGHQRREAPMTSDKQPRLRLKNGSDVDARPAYVQWSMLEAMQARHSEELNLLITVANATQSGTTTKSGEYFRTQYRNWFEPDGQMKTLVREVIQNAIRKTPEGLVIVNPFQLRTQDERDIFKRVQDQDDRFLRDLFRARGEPDSGQSIT
jgi:hypothetical protein